MSARDASMPKRRSEAALDDLAREVVRRRLSVRGDPPTHPSFEEVWAESFEGPQPLLIFSEADARRLYRRAIQRGLVGIKVTNERVRPTPVGEDVELSMALTEFGRRALHTVDFHAHVLDLGGSANQPDDGDRIQEVLGWTAGASWLQRSLTTGDVLALTGGRAVVAAVDALLDTRGLSGVAVYAITGSSEQGTGRVAGASLDADSVVRRIVSEAPEERRPAEVRYVTLPLALEPEVMERHRPKGLLGRVGPHVLDSWWKRRRPEVTLLGVARVSRRHSPNHPLFVSRNPFIADLIGELDELLDRDQQDELVIGELCHQLWVVSPTKGKLAQSAVSLCQRLNERMVAPTFEGLSHGRRTVVIGGGMQKAPVIRSLLRGGARPCVPSNLYTDTATAIGVLDQGR